MRTIVHGVRTGVLTILVTSFSLTSFSQAISTFDGRLEIGASIGPMFFLGDLGGNPGKGKGFVKDLNLTLTKMPKDLYATFHPDEAIGFRLAVNQGQVEGADSVIHDQGGEEVDRMVRNLHFRSNILEFYGAVELYPTVFLEQYDGLQGKFRPYGVIGVGLFHFNPQGRFVDVDGSEKWVDLRPLHLEGQGMTEFPDRPEYKTTQVCIPMGLGFKFYPSETVYIGIEALMRKTFTDYIDDVSKNYIDPALFDKYLEPDQTAVAYQMYNRGYGSLTRPANGDVRGNPKNNDSYFSTVLRLGWRFSTDRVPRSALCPRY